jgi:hypothetical protein
MTLSTRTVSFGSLLSSVSVAHAHPGHGGYLSSVVHGFAHADQYMLVGGTFLLISIVTSIAIVGRKMFRTR